MNRERTNADVSGLPETILAKVKSSLFSIKALQNVHCLVSRDLLLVHVYQGLISKLFFTCHVFTFYLEEVL